MIFSYGSIPSSAKRGLVCSLSVEFMMVLMAFLCNSDILLMLDWDVMLVIFVQYSR